MTFLVHLELEDIAPLGTVLNSWVEELGFLEPLAVEVVVPGGKSHFFLAKDEREELLLPTPFGCREMERDFCELLNKVSHRVEGGFPDNIV